MKSYPEVRINGVRKYEHRIRAEKALGKPLPPRAQVHHVDGSRRADAPLVICQDRRYHALLHTRTLIVKAGGNPNTDKICTDCRRLFQFTCACWRCKPCQNAYVKRNRLSRIAAKNREIAAAAWLPQGVMLAQIGEL